MNCNCNFEQEHCDKFITDSAFGDTDKNRQACCMLTGIRSPCDLDVTTDERDLLLICCYLTAAQRAEAIAAALAKRNAMQDADMPVPFKRQSLIRRTPVENGSRVQQHGGTGLEIICE